MEQKERRKARVARFAVEELDPAPAVKARAFVDFVASRLPAFD